MCLGLLHQLSPALQLLCSCGPSQLDKPEFSLSSVYKYSPFPRDSYMEMPGEGPRKTLQLDDGPRTFAGPRPLQLPELPPSYGFQQKLDYSVLYFKLYSKESGHLEIGTEN